MDANKTAGEEARRQLHKNATCNLKQVLAATPHKTPTVRPPAPYHENMMIYIYIYTYIYIYIFKQHFFVNANFIKHHHHIALVARISLTLSRHSSLSFIALGRSSGRYPVSSHSCWMYVRAGRPAFARPCVGVHKSTSLMSSSLLLQQCPAYLVRLTWIVFVIGGRWHFMPTYFLLDPFEFPYYFSRILEALYIRNLQPALNRINFQTSAHVLKCLLLLALFTELHLKANAIIFNGKDVLTK